MNRSLIASFVVCITYLFQSEGSQIESVTLSHHLKSSTRAAEIRLYLDALPFPAILIKAPERERQLKYGRSSGFGELCQRESTNVAYRGSIEPTDFKMQFRRQMFLLI
jgi:hypothetical protein